MNKYSHIYISNFHGNQNKKASAVTDSASKAISSLGMSAVLPYQVSGGIINDMGSIAAIGEAIARGKLPDDEEIGAIENANNSKALIPTVGSHRVAKRNLHAAGKALSSKDGHAGKNMISEALGSMSGVALPGITGALAGYLSTEDGNTRKIRAIIGGLSGMALGGIINSGARYVPSMFGDKPRTNEEQKTHDAGIASNAILNMLPGVGAYNSMERLRSHGEHARRSYS